MTGVVTALVVVLGVGVVVAWVALVVRTIREVLREVDDPHVQGMWIVVVLAMPFVGPLAWAIVRGHAASVTGRL